MYISRVSGDDSWSCDQSKPCKTIWRAVTRASSGDRIHLDGTNTDKDPYTCQSGTSGHPGIFVNKSLSLIGFGSPVIRCSEGTNLVFNGSNRGGQMDVTLSGLLVKESFLNVQDSSVKIDGCKFEGSKQSLKIVISTKKVSSVEITNSNFSKNKDCLSVFASGTNSPSQDTQVVFTLINSSFDSNVLSDEGGCISFTESPYNNHSVSCNITLAKVKFAGNKFGSKGLLFLKLDDGNQNICLQDVAFINNSQLSAHHQPGDSECVVDSTVANIFIDGSNFTSQTARAFNVSASNISLQIYNSSFCGHRVQGDGGIISLRGADHCELNVSKSSFVDASADRGGAINIECANVDSASFHEDIFTGSTARQGAGGAVYFADGLGFSKNSKWLDDEVHILEVVDCIFDSNSVWGLYGGAFAILTNSARQAISMVNSTFNNCFSPHGGGAVFLENAGNLSFVIKRSRFVENKGYLAHGGGGALFLLLAPDRPKDPGCTRRPPFLLSYHNGDSEKYPTWDYYSHLFIEDTTFERNVAVVGGAVFLGNGKATFQNCSFMDNFAMAQGGHIYTSFGSASLTVQSSLFLQTVNFLQVEKTYYYQTSFIHAESSGALKVYNTTMDAPPYAGGKTLMLVRNGRLIDLGNAEDFTSSYCPVGSRLEIGEFSNIITTPVNDTPCNINVTTFWISCFACAENFYSLQRGHARGSHVAPGFRCLLCPFGANCSQSVVANPNFWGFREKANPPTLKFAMCPLGYCNPAEKADFPEYNGCLGNRSGELCGQCNGSYTETLYSRNCRPTHECKDYWFWPVAFVYVSLMALYFTFKPSMVSWIKRQILWFKEHEPANPNDNFDGGYVKIIFYFYQVANLLLVSNSPGSLIKTKLLEPIVGLFNFQLKLSSTGLICPFPGLTVVTKQLFSASHVCGTFLMIGIFFVLGWGVQKVRGQGAPSVGPYTGGVLQTMLLGYTTLASVSFSLLRCVPIGSEKRLYYDGNIACFQWWQYILIAFICTFFVPFVFVLFWGSSKLYGGTLSVKKFLLACSFPLPSVIYWAFVSLYCKASSTATEDSPPNQMSRTSVEKVLYDAFKRPENGRKLSLSWESVMIGRRLILIVLRNFVSDRLPRLLIMSFFCTFFLFHHSVVQPFRDSIANTVETVSLLSIVVLATVNVFFASFLSLAVPLNDHFSSWWNACQVVEIAILCFIPAAFSLLVVAVVLSQVCRLSLMFGHLLCKCFSRFCGKQDNKTTPLLVPVTGSLEVSC